MSIQLQENRLVISIPLAGNTIIKEAQDYAATLFPEMKRLPSEEFHLTLAFAPDVKDIDVSTIELPEFVAETFLVSDWISSGDFNDAVVLEIDKSSALNYIQSSIYYQLRDLGLTISGFSIPDTWRPHITLGTMDTPFYDYYYFRTVVKAETISVLHGDNLITSLVLKGFSGSFKSIGDNGWVGMFSNIFWDRDVKHDAPLGERFTLDGFTEYIDWTEESKNNLPELWFFHLEQLKMGKALEVFMAGPFAFAIGTWDTTELGQKSKDYFTASEEEWSMSHGFRYNLTDRVEGAYEKFRIKELTVLPTEYAANPLTQFFKEIDDMSMRTDIITSVAKLLGVTEDEAKSVFDTKVVSPPLKEGEAEGIKEVEEDIVDMPQLVKSIGILAKGIGDINTTLSTTTEETNKRLTVLEAALTVIAKDKAKSNSLLPAAVQKAMKQGKIIEKEDVTADMKQHARDAAEVKIEANHAEDPLGWVMKMAGVGNLTGNENGGN